MAAALWWQMHLSHGIKKICTSCTYCDKCCSLLLGHNLQLILLVLITMATVLKCPHLLELWRRHAGFSPQITFAVMATVLKHHLLELQEVMRSMASGICAGLYLIKWQCHVTLFKATLPRLSTPSPSTRLVCPPSSKNHPLQNIGIMVQEGLHCTIDQKLCGTSTWRQTRQSILLSINSRVKVITSPHRLR